MTSETLRIASQSLSAEIAREGAELVALRDGEGRDLLWDGDSAVWSGRAPLLFPIVGALNGHEYRLGGQSFRLPKHGFARRRTFEVAGAGPGSATLRLAADAETLAAYPFSFELLMTFAVSGARLTTTAEIINHGESPMPASFGFHPAFRWPLPYGRPREAHRIRFAEAEPAPIRRIDAQGLVRSEAMATPVQGRELMLRDGLFDDDVVIFDRLCSRSLDYGADTGPRLQIGFGDAELLGIWTRPGAGYVCIEPWRGIADPVGFGGDFTDKPGVFQVAPGGRETATMTVELVG